MNFFTGLPVVYAPPPSAASAAARAASSLAARGRLGGLSDIAYPAAALLRGLRARYPGLYFSGNFLNGPAIGTCVEQALKVADEIRAIVRQHLDDKRKEKVDKMAAAILLQSYLDCGR